MASSSSIYSYGMSSTYKSPMGSVTSTSTSTMEGPKFTIPHMKDEYENLLQIYTQIQKTYENNISRFAEHQADQVSLLSQISQLNIKYQRMESSDIPQEDVMLQEKLQNKADLSSYQNICAEVQDFANRLLFDVDRLKHAPNPQHLGSNTMIDERQSLHKESEALHRGAKIQYYSEAEALCKNMFNTNANLETEVLLHKKIFKQHHGEYLLTKGARFVSGYFWKTPPIQPTETNNLEQPTITPSTPQTGTTNLAQPTITPPTQQPVTITLEQPTITPSTPQTGTTNLVQPTITPPAQQPGVIVSAQATQISRPLTQSKTTTTNPLQLPLPRGTSQNPSYAQIAGKKPITPGKSVQNVNQPLAKPNSSQKSTPKVEEEEITQEVSLTNKTKEEIDENEV